MRNSYSDGFEDGVGCSIFVTAIFLIGGSIAVLLTRIYV